MLKNNRYKQKNRLTIIRFLMNNEPLKYLLYYTTNMLSRQGVDLKLLSLYYNNRINCKLTIK